MDEIESTRVPPWRPRIPAEIHTTRRREPMGCVGGELLRVPGGCSVRGWDVLGQAIRRVQTAIHLLPEKLAALGAGGEGAVVQIAAEVTQGITDATPFIGAEIRCQGHRLKTFDTQHG